MELIEFSIWWTHLWEKIRLLLEISHLGDLSNVMRTVRVQFHEILSSESDLIQVKLLWKATSIRWELSYIVIVWDVKGRSSGRNCGTSKESSSPIYESWKWRMQVSHRQILLEVSGPLLQCACVVNHRMHLLLNLARIFKSTMATRWVKKPLGACLFGSIASTVPCRQPFSTFREIVVKKKRIRHPCRDCCLNGMLVMDQHIVIFHL